jgi:hypothetical protein
LDEYCRVGINTNFLTFHTLIYFNLYLEDGDNDNATTDSTNQINPHGPLKKKSRYSALSEEQREEVVRSGEKRMHGKRLL